VCGVWTRALKKEKDGRLFSSIFHCPSVQVEHSIIRPGLYGTTNGTGVRYVNHI
jgi:hypothetical protein